MENENMVPNRMVSSWAYITEAEDVPGCWVAQCFEFGLASFGESPQHALEMIRGAVCVALEDDLTHGFDSRQRVAPEAEWAPLTEMFNVHKNQVPISGMNTTAFTRFAAPFTVFLEACERDVTEDAHPSAVAA